MAVPTSQRAIREAHEFYTSQDQAVRMERFEPGAAGIYPAVLLLHGSGGLPSEGGEYRATAQAFAEHGYLVLLIHYLEDIGGRVDIHKINPVRFLGWMQKVQDAIDYALQQPHVDTSKVGMVGVSLGAYLSLAVASQDERIGAVVDYFGGLPAVFDDDVEQMPPVLILHGDSDHVVPVSEAYRLEKLLKKHQVSHEMKIYLGQGHGFMGAAYSDALQRSLDFLGRHLKPA